MVIPAAQRREFASALGVMVETLFARSGDLAAVNLSQFYHFFEGAELPKTVAVVARIVEQRTFGHFAVEEIGKSQVRGDTFRCRVFLRFVAVSAPAGSGRPMYMKFAFGPRKGVVVC